jgi:hypothetical protein
VQIADKYAVEVDADGPDAWESRGRAHGTGFLHDWVLQLQDQAGEWHYYYTDLQFQARLCSEGVGFSSSRNLSCCLSGLLCLVPLTLSASVGLAPTSQHLTE